MTGSGNDFGETLRRALAVAGQVEPAGDGLERIRAQVRARTPRPRLAAALAVVFPWPVYRLLQYRTMVGDALLRWLAALIALSARLGRWLSHNTTVAAREIRQAGTAAGRPRHAAEHDPLSGHIGWIRPALAAASVAFAATLAMTVPPVRQAIVQLGSSVISTNQTQGGSGGTLTNGAHTLMNSPGQGIGTSASRSSPSVTPASSCAAPNPTPGGAASGAANNVQQANRGTTTCATPSAAATVAPTSPAPSASPTGSPTSSAPDTTAPTAPTQTTPSDTTTPANQADQATPTP